MLYAGCAEAEMLELEPLLPGRHACTQGRRCRSVPAVYPVTAAVIARASARSRSTAHVRRWRPALAGHPAERRPPGRRKPLPRGGEGKGFLRDIRLPARAAYIAIMSQLTRTCQSQVDAAPDPGRVAVGPGPGGLCQAARLTVTVKPLADPEKVRLIRRSVCPCCGVWVAVSACTNRCSARPQRGAGASPSPLVVSTWTCSCRSHFRRGVLRRDLR